MCETGRPESRVGLHEFKGEQWLAHSGSDDGFLSFIALSPRRNVGVVLMINYDRAPLQRILEATVSTALGSEDKK